MEYPTPVYSTFFPQPKIKKFLFQSLGRGRMMLLEMFQTLFYKLLLLLEREKSVWKKEPNFHWAMFPVGVTSAQKLEERPMLFFCFLLVLLLQMH